MPNQPRITTIIPTYRRPPLLKRAITSVLKQSYPHFQVAIYDNASGDETEKAVSETAKGDERVVYFRHEHNIGAAPNFNFGLKRVHTEYFSFLSDDDILLPDFYKIALAGFEKHPEAAFSAAEVVYLDADGTSRGSSNPAWSPGCYPPPSGLQAMARHGHPPTWTGVLFRSRVVQEVGLLDQEVGIAIDYDFEQRIAARFSFVISNSPGAIFVIDPASWGHKPSLDSVWPGWLKMIKNVSQDERIPLDVRREFEEHVTRQLRQKLFYFGRQAVKQKLFGEVDRAARILGQDLDAPASAFLLRSTGRCCALFPPAHAGLTRLNALRRAFLPPARPAATAEENPYARYLTA